MRFPPFDVRPVALFAVIALCLSLSSCQCSWKPDVGPVDDEEGSAVAVESNFDEHRLRNAGPHATAHRSGKERA